MADTNNTDRIECPLARARARKSFAAQAQKHDDRADRLEVEGRDTLARSHRRRALRCWAIVDANM